VCDLGPQLFPDREDSTAVGPDVSVVIRTGKPTGLERRNRTLDRCGSKPQLGTSAHLQKF